MLISLFQNLYIFGNFLINLFIAFNCFVFFYTLCSYKKVLSPLNSRLDFQFLSLHILLQISDKLSTRFDNEIDVNLKLLTNFSLYVTYFLLGIQNPRWLFDYKTTIISRTIMKYYRNFFWSFILNYKEYEQFLYCFLINDNDL